ncbi:hypothetical protein A5698_17380 [Mycobacterium sp. E136]|nr:hypothetical protein A5698_17380 [Mycobacterium sp. E136]
MDTFELAALAGPALTGFSSIDSRQDHMRPVFRNTEGEAGYWMFTDYAAILEGLQHPEMWSSSVIVPTDPDPPYQWIPVMVDPPIDFDSRPSDLFRSHFYGCFIDDEHGLENRYTIGVDRITLEIDFPHSESNWPNSRKRAAEVLAGVPDGECALTVEENARRMLRFPRS